MINKARLLFCVLVLGVAQLGVDANPPQPRELPRQFQGAWLGMTMPELISRQPNIAVTKRTNFATVTLIANPQDRYIQRIVYRFHENVLYEIETRYRPDRLPQGPSGLLARLKQAYGPPTIDRENELDDARAGIIRRRTIWEDAKTRIMLLEREYLRDGNSVTEISLTITDLALQRRRDEAQERQVNRKMQEVPIPQPEA
ncbi:MAG TPA: hypothetical protein VFS39_14680 [Nitrospira sp.]|nr:hypothetical protein [Nitrospira sp.]